MSDDITREFVDTNVLVYAHDSSAGRKHQIAGDLLRRLWQSRNGCLSLQVLQEFYVTVTRKVAHPLSLEEAAAVVRDLSFWQVHSPNVEDMLGAVDIQRHSEVSFWDAMVIHSAVQLGCAVIWSEDLTDGQKFGATQIMNPFQQPGE